MGCNSWNTEVHFALKVNESGTLFLFPGNHVKKKGSMDILETQCQKDCKANSLVTTHVGTRAFTQCSAVDHVKVNL